MATDMATAIGYYGGASYGYAPAYGYSYGYYPSYVYAPPRRRCTTPCLSVLRYGYGYGYAPGVAFHYTAGPAARART
jgi:hypothetical protein